MIGGTISAPCVAVYFQLTGAQVGPCVVGEYPRPPRRYDVLSGEGIGVAPGRLKRESKESVLPRTPLSELQTGHKVSHTW